MAKKLLIVGLGNPGKEYEKTRHNIGFMFVDFLVKKHGTKPWKLNELIDAFVAEGMLELSKKKKYKAYYAKPQLFVNLSGHAVKKLQKLYKVKPAEIVVAHDDMDIPFGKAKLSFDARAAKHKGVASVIKALKTQKFYRLRFGTMNQQLARSKNTRSKKKKISFSTDFVVSNFTKKEKTSLNTLFKQGVEKLININ